MNDFGLFLSYDATISPRLTYKLRMATSEQNPYKSPHEDAPPVITTSKADKLLWLGVCVLALGFFAAEFFNVSELVLVGAVFVITAYAVRQYRNQ